MVVGIIGIVLSLPFMLTLASRIWLLMVLRVHIAFWLWYGVGTWAVVVRGLVAVCDGWVGMGWCRLACMRMCMSAHFVEPVQLEQQLDDCADFFVRHVLHRSSTLNIPMKKHIQTLKFHTRRCPYTKGAALVYSYLVPMIDR